jgi:chemotaxis protein MotB
LAFSCSTTPQTGGGPLENPREAELQKKVDDLTKDKTDLTAQVADLKTRSDKSLQDFADLQKKDTDLASRYASLQTKNEQAQKDYNDLLTQIQGLKQSINDKDTQLTGLNQQIDELKKANTSLTEQAADKSDLDTRVAALTKERADLSTQLAALQSRLDAANATLEKENQRIARMVSDLKSELGDLIKTGQADVYEYGGVLVTSINEQVVFKGESPNLLKSFSPILSRLAAILKNAPDKVIRVEGYTADYPASKWNSWDLGAMRGTAVVKFLQNQGGIDPQRLVAVSLGSYRPVAPNDTEANRMKNRRVQLVLVDKALYELKDMQKVNIQ